MNRERRKEITRISEALNELRYDLSAVADAEREAYDNMPDSLKDSANGQAADECAAEIEELVATLEEIDTRLIEAAA